MTTIIDTNLNPRSDACKNAAPRLQAGLDNIAEAHGATGLLNFRDAIGNRVAYVAVRYKSGALLRDVVAYLDEMQVLD